MEYGPDITHNLKGVFLPLWLISRPDLGHGAKLLYVLLAQKAGVTAVARAFIPSLATELGDEEAQIYQYLNELECCRLIDIRRLSAETEILHCAFPAYERSPRPSSACGGYGEKRVGQSCLAGSRHPLEICVQYAKAKKRAGEDIRNVYALGTHFHRTGSWDEEMDIFIAGGDLLETPLEANGARRDIQ